MQLLRNKTTNAEYVITGAIGVPREINENTFEVWTHFSVDLGEGQIDTIEVHPESTEWEVVDVPDPEPAIEPPIEPEPAVLTEEQIAAQNAANARILWHQKKAALKQMIDDMRDLQALGVAIAPEKLAVIQELAQWCDDNVKEEYYL